MKDKTTLTEVVRNVGGSFAEVSRWYWNLKITGAVAALDVLAGSKRRAISTVAIATTLYAVPKIHDVMKQEYAYRQALAQIADSKPMALPPAYGGMKLP